MQCYQPFFLRYRAKNGGNQTRRPASRCRVAFAITNRKRKNFAFFIWKIEYLHVFTIFNWTCSSSEFHWSQSANLFCLLELQCVCWEWQWVLSSCFLYRQSASVYNSLLRKPVYQTFSRGIVSTQCVDSLTFQLSCHAKSMRLALRMKWLCQLFGIAICFVIVACFHL